MSNTDTDKTNTEPEEDFLDVDQPISGQHYVCISFISPEKVIKQKEVFFMQQFMLELLQTDVKREYLAKLDPAKLTYEKVHDMIEDFRVANETRVNDLFDEANDFKTSTRGVKVRGTYDTLKEAKVRAKILQKRDPKFHVFVGQVGYWLPWDPTNTDTVEQKYGEKQLNDLMKGYKQNIENRDVFYQQDKQNKVDVARKETEVKKKALSDQGINPAEKEPKDSMEKVNELRDIMAEKDKIYNDIQNQDQKPVANPYETAEVITIATPPATTETKPPQMQLPADMDDDPLGSKSGYSDPWMQRKMEETAAKQAPTQANNISSVVKEIF